MKSVSSTLLRKQILHAATADPGYTSQELNSSACQVVGMTYQLEDDLCNGKLILSAEQNASQGREEIDAAIMRPTALEIYSSERVRTPSLERCLLTETRAVQQSS